MEYTNENNVPLSLAVWLATDTYDYNADPSFISATTLLNPLRAIVLARQNVSLKKSGDVSALIPSRMGTAYHDGIEKSWLSKDLPTTLRSLGYPKSVSKNVIINPDISMITPDSIPVYMEQRGVKKIGNYNISGKFDFVAEGTLEDFKSTSVYTVIFGNNDVKYIQQGSIYRWIFPNLITEDHMHIRFIFTDWDRAKARYDKKYPQSKLLTKTLRLMSIPETKTFVKGIVTKIDKLMPEPQSNLPLCTKEELWQRDDVWKYYKNPTSTKRSTKNYDSNTDAHQRYIADGSVGMIKHIPGEVVKCRYCNVREICDQAQRFITSGLLKF